MTELKPQARRSWLSWLGLAICLATVMVATFFTWRLEQGRIRARFLLVSENLKERLLSRMGSHEQILMGAAQFAAQTPSSLTPKTWKAYVAALDLGRLNPGVQALGFAEWVRLPDLAGQVRRIQAGGRQEYVIHPGGPLPPEGGMSPVTLVEPFDARNSRALGKDMLGDPTRRTALFRARDTGQVTITGKVTLYVEDPGRTQAGTLLYMPIYRPGSVLDTPEQRREALVGWVYLSFRMQNLMDEVFGPSDRGLDIELFDGEPDPGHRLFSRTPEPWAMDSAVTAPLEVAGRIWTLRTAPTFSFRRGLESRKYLAVLGLGLLTSFALFGLLRSLSRGEQEAQRMAEKAIEESEFRFRTMFELLPVGVTLLASSGQVLLTNTASETLLGLSVAEHIMRDHLDPSWALLRPDASPMPPEETPAARALESGQRTENVTMGMRRPDGRIVWLSVSAEPIHQAGMGAILVYTDITVQREMVEALRASEDRFRQLAEVFPEIIFEASLDGILTYVNDRTLLLHGIPNREAILGRSLLEFVHPDDVGMVRARITERVTGKEGGFLEYRALRPNGVPFDAMAFLTILREEGRPTGFRGFILEITERKRMEEQITMERDLFAGGPVSVFLWRIDTGLSVDYVSRNVEQLLGYTAAEMMAPAFRFSSIVHPEDLPRIEQELQAHMASNVHRFEQNYRIMRRDGVYRWVYDFNVLQRDTAGQVTLIHGYLIDLTLQKEAEQRLRATNRHLELATARAREMTQEAERANASKSEFLANMSHEIRTPMNGVLGMAELLGTTTLNPEQRDYVSAIYRSGASLLSILNDILDFSKIEAGQLTLETIAFDLEQLVYDVAELFRAKLEGHEVELLLDFDLAGPSQVEGDPGRIRQILGNLISNAIKFTQRGYVLVKVHAEPTEAGPWRYDLSVQDTGIGISAQKQVRLFQPFVQADSSTARRYGGTGLGLALVKRLVEAMKGKVQLESQEGVGTTIRAQIPLGVAQGEAAGAPQGQALTGRRILVIDDLAINRKLHGRYLEAQGATTAQAESGADALQMLFLALDVGLPFDGALVDLHMPPGMDGATFGRMVRSDPRCARLALVVLTGTTIKGEGEQLAELGFDGYLHKPIRGATLAQAMGVAIRRRSVQADGPLVTRHTVAGDQPSGASEAHLTLEARILLVEDQEVNQAIARKFLEMAGAKVAVAGNGKIALAMLEGQAFDLILMDCQMPEMDGFEATIRIRADEQKRGGHIPIIAMTAHAMAGDRDRCLRSGMDGYLTKPIAREVLIHEVAQWLPERSAHPEEPRGGRTIPEVAATPPVAPGPNGLPVAPPDLKLDPVIFESLWDVFGRDGQKMTTLVIEPFLDRGHDFMEQLHGALTSGDRASIGTIAHTLKGSSRTLALNALGQAAELLEREGATASKERLGTYLEDLEAHFSKAAAFLRTVIHPA
jgi:PAS domain S-box-containing protein